VLSCILKEFSIKTHRGSLTNKNNCWPPSWFGFNNLGFYSHRGWWLGVGLIGRCRCGETWGGEYETSTFALETEMPTWENKNEDKRTMGRDGCLYCDFVKDTWRGE
jgi:hypothetical protein